VHDDDPTDVVDVELPGTVVDVEVVDVEVVVVARAVVVVVPLLRRSGRTNASAATASGFRTCTAAQRACAPKTCPHAALVWIGTQSGVSERADAPPAVATRTTAPTASATATVTTRNFRDFEIDIRHPTREKAPTDSYRPSHRHAERTPSSGDHEREATADHP